MDKNDHRGKEHYNSQSPNRNQQRVSGTSSQHRTKDCRDKLTSDRNTDSKAKPDESPRVETSLKFGEKRNKETSSAKERYLARKAQMNVATYKED